MGTADKSGVLVTGESKRGMIGTGGSKWGCAVGTDRSKWGAGRTRWVKVRWLIVGSKRGSR